jgi:hypothetical protein
MPDGRTPTGLLFSLTLISLAAAFKKTAHPFTTASSAASRPTPCRLSSGRRQGD